MIEKMGFVGLLPHRVGLCAATPSSDGHSRSGRGAAARRASWWRTACDITDIDPMKYGLFFERFLNPERVSMPDIDMDFGDTRRGEVVDYVRRKYGDDHVAQIVTFGTMAARGAIRDVGRALNMTYADGGCGGQARARRARCTSRCDEALKLSRELREHVRERRAACKKLIDTAARAGGDAAPRLDARGGRGHHRAAGRTTMCRWRRTTTRSSRQYTMTTLEELGLLKMDFLGLRNLTVHRRRGAGWCSRREPGLSRWRTSPDERPGDL